VRVRVRSAASFVVSASRKPTVTVMSQPPWTMVSTFGPKSVSAWDSAWLILMPSSDSAFFSPS
jgi:hypothetical protein